MKILVTGAGKPEEVIQTLLTMFCHYNESGFMGNAQSATALLGRTPVSFTEFLTKELSLSNK